MKVRFYGRNEIRMGSPYNLCKVKLSGDWTPDLPAKGWQDLFAQSGDGRFTVLVQWDTTDNEPGFVLHLIDEQEKARIFSPRIPGICIRLGVQDNAVHYRAWSIHGETDNHLSIPSPLLGIRSEWR